MKKLSGEMWIWGRTTFGLAVLVTQLHAAGTQPMVAIHDSELTRAMEGAPASGLTPAGPGTTGHQWWLTNWHYFVMPESLQETLRSDGTAFAVVSDADISAGALLDENGNPRYPILISLASEAVRDDEIGPMTNYVAAGGFLFVGSSAFTRQPDGSSRGDFALATQMGVHSVLPGFQNWATDSSFIKQQNHRILSHLPSGQLAWRMPLSADETQWGVSPAHPFQNAHYIWSVKSTDATVLADGDGTPYLLTKQYGKGQFIYDAALQPLIAHGGYAPGMYAYGIFRKVIEWAFDSAQLPIPKLSPWPFPYDAAFVVRHDLEDYQDEIANIQASAQFEAAHGAAGDYYFCTGTLREEMGNNPGVIAGLSNAVVLYNATIGSHNGGLRNPDNLGLNMADYDYWHWGPDEVLDTDVSALGFSSGKAYALTSISNSFTDLEGWLGQTPNFGRSWVGCYFNSTREDSYDILNQLGNKTVGEQKLGPFPHWTVSTRTSGMKYPMVTLPVSDWYIGSQIGQALETGHTTNSVRALVDFYYGMGALINLYGHTLSVPGYSPGVGGTLPQEYITYSLNSALHPRLWSANAAGIYSWWQKRSGAQITTSSSRTGNQTTLTFLISGATDPSTAVELLLPSSSPYSGLAVLANGAPAAPSLYRLTGQTLKIQVGTSISRVDVSYLVGPLAQNDFFTVAANSSLNVPAPGVKANDADLGGLGGDHTTVISAPANGQLTLANDGGFLYVPTPGFTGIDVFNYQLANAQSGASAASAVISVLPPASLFFDDFSRPTDPGSLLPWVAQMGNWGITSGVMEGGLNSVSSYAYARRDGDWSNYTFECRLQFPAGAFAGGIGGRLNSATGAHYGAWIYPETFPGGAATLSLIKFQGWTTWGYNGVSFSPMQQVTLPSGVGTGWHTLKLACCSNRLAIYLDGALVLSATDTEAQPYLSGGISLDQYTDALPYLMSVDDVLVKPFAADDAYTADQNTSLTVAPPGVLANDLPFSGTTLTASSPVGPSHGTVAMDANGDGGFVYTPDPGFYGLDSFTYQSQDPAQVVGTATVTIKVRPFLVVTPDNQSRAYGANNPTLTGTLQNLLPGDAITATYATTADNHSVVGPYAIVATVHDPGGQLGNYAGVILNQGTLSVTQAMLTVTAKANNKAYDGTTSATVTLSDNRLPGDDITEAFTGAAFADKVVGNNKPVTVAGISMGGAAAANYTLGNTTSATTANITALAITVTATGINKVYDTTRTATVTLADNRLPGDQVTDNYTNATFADKTVGTNKTVTVTGISVSGPDAPNYTLQNIGATTTANITRRPLTVFVTVANSKVYDGTTNTTVSLDDTMLVGDHVTDQYVQAYFSDKRVGTNKTVTVTGIYVFGTDANNYALQNTNATGAANITVRSLKVTAKGVDKVYDAKTNATVTLSNNKVAADVVTNNYTNAFFASKIVGTNKTVNVQGISMGGADAANYTLQNLTTTAKANITVRPLTVTATGIDKIYNGSAAATVVLADNKITGDIVNESYTGASFNNKNVGSNKPVTASGIALSGADSLNYALQNATANTTANIMARALAVSAAGVNKVYDGTTTASVNLSDNRVPGDQLTENYAGAVFADKTVGVGKAVSVSGISTTGPDALNYSLQNTTANTTADITGKALVVSAQGIAKVYDGTSVATVTLLDNRVAGDTLSESYTSASFGDKNVGGAKPVSVSGLSISGADAGNYSANTSATTSADITARPITVTAVADTKTYDGSVSSGGVPTVSGGLGAGDSAGFSQSFDDKNAGSGKTLSPSGSVNDGNGGKNYAVEFANNTSGVISALSITGSITAASKVYDGTTAATISSRTLSGVLGSDDVRYAGGTAGFADGNVGVAKTVTANGLSLSGGDAANYTVNTSATTTADITALALTGTISVASKPYDGTSGAIITARNLSGNVSGDDVSYVGGSASFSDKNAGVGKTVIATDLSLSGAAAGNYTVNSTAGTTADITGKALVVSAQGIAKVYDGTSVATVTLLDNRVAGDTLSESYTSASFGDKNVGSAKPVSVGGLSISGPDAGNYSANTSTTTSADITARPITVTAVADSKTYDGSVSSGGVPTVSGGLGAGDSAGFSQSFDSKNAGSAKTLSPSGSVNDGNGGKNYAVEFANNTSGVISALSITGSITAASKVYDGTTAATIITRALGGVLGNDDVSYAGGTAGFADANAGLAKAVSASGLSLSGVDAGNYAVNTSATTTADITAATLTVIADNKIRTWGQANPALTATITGFVDLTTSSPGNTPGVAGSPDLSTIASVASPVGTYPILAGVGTLSSPNYVFTFVPGTLTIMAPPNTRPVLPVQADRSLVDLTTLTMNNAGVDSDLPAQSLSYQLLDPPAGMTIDPSGVITWTPKLAQSPSTNIITTVVTDDGSPPLSDTNSFTLIVSGPYDGIDLTNPTQAIADLDGDQMSNLMEYGLGTDPRNSTDGQSAFLTGVATDSGNQYASITFKRRKQDGGISIQYLPEVSADGQTWYSDSAHVETVSVTPLDAQFDWVLVRDQVPTTGAVPRFIRLRVIEN